MSGNEHNGIKLNVESFLFIIQGIISEWNCKKIITNMLSAYHTFKISGLREDKIKVDNEMGWNNLHQVPFYFTLKINGN